MRVSRETAADRDTVSTEYERRLEQQARNLCRWRRWAREYRRVTGRRAAEPVYLFAGCDLAGCGRAAGPATDNHLTL